MRPYAALLLFLAVIAGLAAQDQDGRSLERERKQARKEVERLRKDPTKLSHALSHGGTPFGKASPWLGDASMEEVAIFWLERAIQDGDPEGAYYLGLLHRHRGRPDEAIAALERGYRMSRRTSALEIQWALLELYVLERPDAPGAAAFLDQYYAGEAGAERLFFTSARFNAQSLKEEDPARRAKLEQHAREYLASAAERKYVPAQLALGRALRDGTMGFPADVATGEAQLLQLAAAGIAEAWMDVLSGSLEMRQHGIPLMQRKADAGDTAAQEFFGLVLAAGSGVQSDHASAFYYLHAAAKDERTNTPARHQARFALAELYAKGLGTEKNLQEARRWYRRAADFGYPRAEVERALQALER